jgi:Acetokinase family
MTPANPRILAIHGESSGIKFALFDAGGSLRRILEGGIGRIGLPEANLRVNAVNQADNFSRLVTVPTHTAAVSLLMDWIDERNGRDGLTAAEHRFVHDGPKDYKPQRIPAEMVEELHRLGPFDPAHLPEEILLTEAFHRRFPHLPQVARFDTAFHDDRPGKRSAIPALSPLSLGPAARVERAGNEFVKEMEMRRATRTLPEMDQSPCCGGRSEAWHTGSRRSLGPPGKAAAEPGQIFATRAAGAVMLRRSKDVACRARGSTWHRKH